MFIFCSSMSSFRIIMLFNSQMQKFLWNITASPIKIQQPDIIEYVLPAFTQLNMWLLLMLVEKSMDD